MSADDNRRLGLADRLISFVRGIGTVSLRAAARNRAAISPTADEPVLSRADRETGILERVCENEEPFVDLLVRRVCPKNRDRGLITVSNHISILDDPLMWSGLAVSRAFSNLPGSIQSALGRAENSRWGLASHDICFQSPFLSRVFVLGQTLPTHRLAHSPLGGPFQPTIAEAVKLLSANPHPRPTLFPATTVFSTTGHDVMPSPTGTESGSPARFGWIHVFPEGRVAQPALEARFPLDPQHAIDEIALMHGHAIRYFKWGIARMILEADPCPDVVPMWISGFDAIAAEPHVLLDTHTTDPTAGRTLVQSLQTRLPLRIAQIAEWINPPPQSHHRCNTPSEGMPRVIFGNPVLPAAWDAVRAEWQALVAQVETTVLKSTIMAGGDPDSIALQASRILRASRPANELRSRVAEMVRQRVLAVGRAAGAAEIAIADRLGLNGPAAKTIAFGIDGSPAWFMCSWPSLRLGFWWSSD